MKIGIPTFGADGGKSGISAYLIEMLKQFAQLEVEGEVLVYPEGWGTAYVTFPVTNEGEGASIAAGVWLTGSRAALIMENSGLRVATESLARLGMTHGIPVVMLMSYRGDVGEEQWYGIPHGITMEPLLQTLRIPYVIVRKAEEIKRAIGNAYKTADSSKYHVAVVFSGEIVQ